MRKKNTGVLDIRILYVCHVDLNLEFVIGIWVSFIVIKYVFSAYDCYREL